MAESNSNNRTRRPPNSMMLRRTLFLLVVCGIIAFIVLGIRLFQLQIIDHDEYESDALNQQVRSTTVDSGRGTIYDTNMKILAMSATVETVNISPYEIAHYEEDQVLIAQTLESILGADYGVEYADIMEMMTDTSSWYKTVARKVESDVADKIREFKTEYNIVGVKLETDSKRYYPYGSLACHVIGFVGIDNDGLSGIEYTYSDVLSGVSGRIVRAKNSYGTDMLYTKYEDYYDAENGYDLVLTIDSTIQYYVEKYLEQALEDYDVQNGAAAICMDVNTGAILAMASLGNFDLNDYSAVSEEDMELIDSFTDPDVQSYYLNEAQQRQWRNTAISDTYEPGSVFKILTYAMALEEGVATLDSTYYCGGSIAVVGREADNPVNCWKTGGHGMQTLTQALQHSCNVAAVELGLEIGAETFYDYIDAFGLFDKTGIELPGESGSIWWSEEAFTASYDKSSLAAASFGQTFNITPLQLITAVSACVNGGYLMQPYIVSETLDSDGSVVSTNEPTVVRQVISEESSATLCQMLEQVVGDEVDGTGKKAYVAGYRIGGKTGTSTDTVIEAATEVKQYIVSFLGVAPMDDPQIAILVLLNNPSNASGVYISGGNMGAPTVGNMMAEILPYLGVEADYTDDELAALDKTVPNVTDMALVSAQTALTNAGLGFRTIGEGDVVTYQLPAANQTVAAGSEIILYCGSEPSEDLEEMPDLTGLTYSTARQRLSYYALFIKTNSSNITDSNTLLVSSQSIEAGTEVEHGTVVEVTLVDSDTSMNGFY